MNPIPQPSSDARNAARPDVPLGGDPRSIAPSPVGHSQVPVVWHGNDERDRHIHGKHRHTTIETMIRGHAAAESPNATPPASTRIDEQDETRHPLAPKTPPDVHL